MKQVEHTYGKRTGRTEHSKMILIAHSTGQSHGRQKRYSRWNNLFFQNPTVILLYKSTEELASHSTTSPRLFFRLPPPQLLRPPSGRHTNPPACTLVGGRQRPSADKPPRQCRERSACQGPRRAGWTGRGWSWTAARAGGTGARCWCVWGRGGGGAGAERGARRATRGALAAGL